MKGIHFSETRSYTFLSSLHPPAGFLAHSSSSLAPTSKLLPFNLIVSCSHLDSRNDSRQSCQSTVPVLPSSVKPHWLIQWREKSILLMNKKILFSRNSRNSNLGWSLPVRNISILIMPGRTLLSFLFLWSGLGSRRSTYSPASLPRPAY